MGQLTALAGVAWKEQGHTGILCPLFPSTDTIDIQYSPANMSRSDGATDDTHNDEEGGGCPPGDRPGMESQRERSSGTTRASYGSRLLWRRSMII